MRRFLFLEKLPLLIFVAFVADARAAAAADAGESTQTK